MLQLCASLFRKARIKRKRSLAFLIAVSFITTMLIGLYLNIKNATLDTENQRSKVNTEQEKQYLRELTEQKHQINEVANSQTNIVKTEKQEIMNILRPQRDKVKTRKAKALRVHDNRLDWSKISYRVATKKGIKLNDRKISVLHGVGPENSNLYMNNSSKIFVCLDGKEVIAKESVNDDYCDCKDGSDEPGTSACNNGRFYCLKDQKYIASSCVNDAICDCCDGSDEWKNFQPIGFIAPKNPAMNYAPCSAVC